MANFSFLFNPRRLLFLLSHVYSYILFGPAYCIHLLYSKQFHLCLHITYICCSLCIIIIILLPVSPSDQHQLIVFHWSLSDSKSPQVSRTPISILANLNNIVVWMVPICPPISNSSSPLSKPWGSVWSVPITIGITVTFMFHSFFMSLVRFKFLSLFLLFFIFIVVCWDSKVHYTTGSPFFFFWLIITWFDLLAGISWFVCISKSLRIMCISLSKMDSGLCIYYLFIWSNFNFLHNSQWISFPFLSYLVLYSFLASLLHSLMRLIISFLSTYNQHLLFCCELSIFPLA